MWGLEKMVDLQEYDIVCNCISICNCIIILSDYRAVQLQQCNCISICNCIIILSDYRERVLICSGRVKRVKCYM